MNLEARLRAATRAMDDPGELDEPGALASVRSRVRTIRRRRRAMATVAAALVVALPVAIVATGDDREPGSVVSPDVTTLPSTVPEPAPTTAPAPTTTAEAVTTATPTTTGAPTTTVAPTTTEVTTTTPPTAPGALDDVLWPAPDGPRFVDAVEAVRSFVAEVVGIGEPPSQLAPARSTGPDTAEVDVFGRNEDGSARDTVVSTVAVRRIDDHWYVTGATAADLVVETPGPREEIGWPVRVAGRGTGYEGTIVVQVRDAFAGPDDLLGLHVAMGGALGELATFEATVAYSAPASDRGFVLVHNDSGLFGIESFTAVPVRFSPAGAGGTTVHATFYRSGEPPPGELVPVARTVPSTTGVLRAALIVLLGGPTLDEQRDGLFSRIPGSPADLEGVDLDGGRAVVRLGERLAPSGTVSAPGMVEQLNATVFQFPNVTSVRYELGTSCEAFSAWAQQPCEHQRAG
jgi:hypothetical protein